MRETIIRNLTARFAAFQDLLEQTDEAALQNRLDVPKSKSVAEHLWCVVGARESYARAIEAGAWQGFSCSMTSFSRDDFGQALNGSASAVVTALAAVEQWTEERDTLLATLNEHEVMHEGQIIRHLYGVEANPPESFRWA